MWLTMRGALHEQREGGAIASITCRASNTALGHLHSREPGIDVKVVRRRAGRLRRQASRGQSRRSDGIEVVSLVGPQICRPPPKSPGKLGIPHWTTNLAEGLAQPGVEAAHPGHAHPAARRAGHAMPARRQARAGRDSDADNAGRRRAGAGGTAGDRPHRHGRPYPPLQSQPSVDPQAHPGRAS